MSSTKIKNNVTNEWEVYGSTEASEIKIKDYEGNFESVNVEGALRETSDKINNILPSLSAYKKTIIEHTKMLVEHTKDIEWLKENGGGGGGSGTAAPTITSTFVDGTIVEKDIDVLIPIFFSSPNLGEGTAYVFINGVEIDSISGIKQGNNKINIGKLNKLNNEVNVYVKDRVNLLSNQLTWNIICGGIDLTIDFDQNADYSITDIISMQFNVTSASSEPIIMHMTIDYTDYEITCNNGFNEYTFAELGVGIHKIALYVTSGPYKTSTNNFNIIIVNATSLYVSSIFKGGTFEYGSPIPIDYRISKMGSEIFTVQLKLDDELIKTTYAPAGSYFWTLSEIEIGSHSYKIIVNDNYGSVQEVTGTFEIIAGDYTPQKIITSGLIYRLNAKGRTNNDADKTLPIDNSGNGIKAELKNFNYFSNGWIDDALVCDGNAYVEIDCYPWAENAIYGSTIEIQFKGLDIGVVGSRILDYTDVETPYKGIYADLEEATMKSLANTGKVYLDADEWITLTYVIDRKNKFGKVYIDGICSRAFSLSDTGSGTSAVREDFIHRQKIYLNSRKGQDKFGACMIKDLRVYSRVLTDDEILCNNIAQVTDLTAQKALYNLNYNNKTLPTMKFYGDTTNMTLETPVTMRVKYTSPNEDKYGQSFDLPYCEVNWQGTSSLQYVLKNYTIRLKDANLADYYYTPYPNGVLENTFCCKADYMESTHSRNTGLAKFVNECLYDEKNPMQLQNPNIRNSVDGFPMLLYVNDTLQGVYNFNLDRYSTKSYGYTDESKCISYEVSANSDTTAGAFYKWTEASGKTELDYYKSDFECLYPPTRVAGNDSMTELIRLIKWVNDSSDEDFKSNIGNYFNLQYLLRYFLYVYVTGAVDSLGKNMKLTTWDGLIWFPQVYDADTTIGLDNTGFLRFDMDIEMGDANVFNTTGSKLWTRVQLLFKTELAQQYAIMRQKQFTVDNMMKYIVEEQISQIPAKYYNIDMQTKYLNYGSSYLYALHGSGYHHIRKWLRERLIYCDTLFGYNVSTSDYITLRSSKLGEVYLDLQTYIPMYVRIKWRDEANNTGVQIKRVARGETVRFTYTMPTATDQEIIIYAGHYLKSLGDVSNLQPTSMLIANADRLTEITCHSPNLINTDLSECTLLQRIDLSDSVLLGTGIGAQPILNIQNCKYLRYCNCMNTQLTAIYTMQQGGNLEELYFPETTQVIQVTNQTYLKTIGIPYGYINDLYYNKTTQSGAVWDSAGKTIKFDVNGLFSYQHAVNEYFEVFYGTEYVATDVGALYIYEFDKYYNYIGRASDASTTSNYTPSSAGVKYVKIVCRYGAGVHLYKDGDKTLHYCKNLATVQITNCNAIKYIQYPFILDNPINFDAFKYVQNLTIINSMPTLTTMSCKGFNKLRNATFQNLPNLTTLGFDNMLGASDVSTFKTMTLSNMPKFTKITFNVDSADYKIAFAGEGKIDMGGLQSALTIESNYSIKGLDTIILPTSIKELRFSNTYGDGINEIKNLWSATSNHASDGFTGIDFQDMTINFINMAGLSQVTNAINFNIAPIDSSPNMNTNRDGTATKPYFKPTGTLDLNNYTGDMTAMLKGVDLSRLNVVLDVNRPQTDLTSLFQGMTITTADMPKINNILAKFPSSTIWDYMFAYTNIETLEGINIPNRKMSLKGFVKGTNITTDITIPSNVIAVDEMFMNCLNLTHIKSNWNNNYTYGITALNCYKGNANITHIDDVELVLDENTTNMDTIPTGWGGYGFNELDVTIFNVDLNLSSNLTISFGTANNSDLGLTSWGDGTFSSERTHTYAKLGQYTIRTKTLLGTSNESFLTTACKLAVTQIVQLGTMNTNLSARFLGMTNLVSADISSIKYFDNILYAFSGCTSLETVKFNETVSTFNFNSIFNGCVKLKNIIGLKYLTVRGTKCYNAFDTCSSLTYLDVSNWDLSNCDDMSSMFANCGNLTTIEGLANINTSNVKTMYYLFYGCNSLTAVDISNWNTSKCASMLGMFVNCRSLTTLNLSSFDTLNITNMTNMFNGCTNLTTLNISSFNVANVTNMNSMFKNCSCLTTLNVSSFDTSKVTDMSYMFQNCSNLTSLDVSNFNTESAIGFPYMFQNCRSLTSLNLSNFNTSNVTSMNAMLQGCTNLGSLNVSTWDTTSLISMSDIFSGCNSLTTIDLSSWDISNVRTINNMFSNCPNLTSLNLSNFNTSNVTNMGYMFNNCSSLTTLDLSNFNTEKVTSMSLMFCACAKLQKINVSSFNTSNVTNMSSMFDSCRSLTSLNLSNFNTFSVTNMNTIFRNCTNLTSLNVSSFDTSNVTNMTAMFNNCEILPYLDLSSFSTPKLTTAPDMFSYCRKLMYLDLSSFNTSTVTNITNMFASVPQTSKIWISSTFTKTPSECNWSGTFNITAPASFVDYTFLNGNAFFPTTVTITGGYSYVDSVGDTHTTRILVANDEVSTPTAISFKDNKNLISILRLKGNLTSTQDMFSGCTNLTSVNLLGLDTSKVTNMYSMFFGCSSLTTLDLSNFNTENVTSMNGAFSGCTNLTSLDLSNFNTSNTTNIANMFYECRSLSSLNLAGFNTAKVTNMGNMFAKCNGLTSLNLLNFDTTNTIYMDNMFNTCSSLTTLDLSNFNTSKVTNMNNMFNSCSSLASLNLTNWNTSMNTSMSGMFQGCSSLTSLDLASFNTGKVTSMANMFYGCSSLTSLDLSNFNTEKVTSMSLMFYSCNNLTTINLLNWNTVNVTNMSSMFRYCSNLTSINLSNFNTSNVVTIEEMFSSCSSLTSLDLSNFDTLKVRNMKSMFSSCNSLTSINLSNFNTSNVVTIEEMFSSCSSLTSLDLSNFDTLKVTNMNNIFYNCVKLTSIDLSSFDTSNVTAMNGMFSWCGNLVSLNISRFSIVSVATVESMLRGCNSLNIIDLSQSNSATVSIILGLIPNKQLVTTLSICPNIDIDLALTSFTNLTVNSLVGILNALVTTTISKVFTLGATNLAKLTEEQKAIAINKGWTLA